MTHYERALAIQPDYADAHNNLGNALLQKGRVDEALDHFHVAVELQPGDASARNNLGNALLSAGRLGEAIPQYEEALKLQPNFAKAHNNLGWSLLQTGRLDEALAHFQKALEVEPDYANAHNNLGFALLRKGRVREAIAHCQTAVKLQPDDAGTLSNLAWLLATSADPAVRDGGQATTLAERANRLSGGREPAVLRALAAAYAEGGRFADACATAQQALQLAESQSNAALAEALRVQLQSYQADLPFREDVKPETRSSKSE
jgi:Flp pilus assembly protein TadD